MMSRVGKPVLSPLGTVKPAIRTSVNHEAYLKTCKLVQDRHEQILANDSKHAQVNPNALEMPITE